MIGFDYASLNESAQQITFALNNSNCKQKKTLNYVLWSWVDYFFELFHQKWNKFQGVAKLFS